MSAKTTIEWTDRSWNCVRGCSRVSPGCDECYAMKFAHRFAGPGKPFEGLTTIRKGKVDWSGVARFIPSELDAPLRWRKPERIFVNSMSDLFHHSLTNEQIAAVFGVMAACPRHTFQVLTKRPERALEFFAWVHNHCSSEDGTRPPAVVGYFARKAGSRIVGPERLDGDGGLFADVRWPLPGVWLGVSVENQETADERIPLLLQCPAAVRWISAEPLLGPLDLRVLRTHERYSIDSLTGLEHDYAHRGLDGGHERRLYERGLDWVVVGGESGPGAREFDVDWARDIVQQCRSAGAACFLKQLGSKPLEGDADRDGSAPVQAPLKLKTRKGGDPTEWPVDLQNCRAYPEARP